MNIDEGEVLTDFLYVFFWHKHGTLVVVALWPQGAYHLSRWCRSKLTLIGELKLITTITRPTPSLRGNVVYSVLNLADSIIARRRYFTHFERSMIGIPSKRQRLLNDLHSFEARTLRKRLGK